jgi:hypothetical protein
MMNMAKANSIDDVVNTGATGIVKYYQTYKDADFDTRIKKNKEFHDKKVQMVLKNEAYEIHHGVEKPGAIQESYKTINKYAKGENDVIKDAEQIKDILESYAIGFLKRTNKKDILAALDEMKAKGESKEDIRKKLGQMFGAYHLDNDGRQMDIFNSRLIKSLQGRSKAEIKASMQGFAEDFHQRHTNYLVGKAFDGYFTLERDSIPLANYVGKVATKLNVTHPGHKTMHTRDIDELIGDVTAYHTKGSLQDQKYVPITKA